MQQVLELDGKHNAVITNYFSLLLKLNCIIDQINQG